MGRRLAGSSVGLGCVGTSAGVTRNGLRPYDSAAMSAAVRGLAGVAPAGVGPGTGATVRSRSAEARAASAWCSRCCAARRSATAATKSVSRRWHGGCRMGCAAGGTTRTWSAGGVMTGPEGDQHAGWWRIAAVAAPTGLEFDDGFGDPDAPSPSLPVSRTRVTISDVGGGVTRLVLAASFPSAEAMDQLLAMEMREGLTAVVGQTDDLLAGAPQR